MTTTSKQTKEGRFFKIVYAGMILFLALATSLMASGQQYNGHYLNNVDANGVIIDGYDPVAFFTDNKPVKGDPQFSFTYEEAVYHFASQEHLDLFKANPEKYKPQFGAWCAYAVSLGRTAPIDVNTFSIVDGRLVIQHNQRAVNGWSKDPEGNLKLADKYWPKVTANGGKQIKVAGGNGWLIWAGSALALLVLAAVLLLRKGRASSAGAAAERRAGTMVPSKM
ncbi:MAG: YHS domain-containing (seleno)protein [Chitinophagaceae bacterium]